MKNISTILALLLLILCSGCNEDTWLEEDPQDALYATNVYNTYTGFRSSMYSVYAKMRTMYGDNKRTMSSLWIENTDAVSTRTSSVNQFDEYTSGWNELEDAYDLLYSIINICNTVINRAEEDDGVDWEGTSDDESAQNKDNIIGEALVARAWAYRLLIYAFGPVPLSVEEITGENYSNAWERNSIEEIKAQMEKDLVEAVERLDFVGESQLQFNGAAARHYLGELYLSQGEFQKAIDVLDTLCNSSEYSLVNSRFGYTANNEDGNYFMDMFRSHYSSEGNTESIFVFSNGAGSAYTGWYRTYLCTAYGGDYRNFARMERTEEEYIAFGGFSRCRCTFTPYSMVNEEDYNRYKKILDMGDDGMTYPETNPNHIDEWLWENTDGRDNYLFEMDDIRGQATSIRRFFARDWDGDGEISAKSISIEEGIMRHEDPYNDQYEDNPGVYIGDTIYTFFLFQSSDDGYLDWYKKHLYQYSRKWEVEEGISDDDIDAEGCTQTVVHLRLADSYLLLAEAYFMNGNSTEAATWINKVRERANASTIDASDVSLDFILDERMRELESEEFRKITLLRTGKYVERTRKYNPLSNGYIQDYHKLFPFPSGAIDANKDNELDQNLGYGGSTTCDFTPEGYPDE